MHQKYASKHIPQNGRESWHATTLYLCFFFLPFLPFLFFSPQAWAMLIPEPWEDNRLIVRELTTTII